MPRPGIPVNLSPENILRCEKPGFLKREIKGGRLYKKEYVSSTRRTDSDFELRYSSKFVISSSDKVYPSLVGFSM
jgi:hypothetical protein